MSCANRNPFVIVSGKKIASIELANQALTRFFDIWF